MNIILIGLMGAGKSAVGRSLAERLGRPFIDTDALVEEQAGRPIPAIFAEEGEEGFRRREAAVIASLRERDGLVVATGGGAVLRPENRAALRSSGVVVWLEAAPEVLLERAAAQGVKTRPLLTGGDPLERLRRLAAERDAAYRETAHMRVRTDDAAVDEVVARILAMMEERGVKLHG